MIPLAEPRRRRFYLMQIAANLDCLARSERSVEALHCIAVIHLLYHVAQILSRGLDSQRIVLLSARS